MWVYVWVRTELSGRIRSVSQILPLYLRLGSEGDGKLPVLTVARPVKCRLRWLYWLHAAEAWSFGCLEAELAREVYPHRTGYNLEIAE